MDSPSHIQEAARRLRSGAVVAFPTETVYGLGADAFSAPAVARVFALKGRPSRNPLIVHVSDVGMAKRVAAAWPDNAQRLADAFWPGPLSLVLPKRAEVPDIVTGGPGSSSVAVRRPRHPVALALLEAFGSPLVGPSANLSGAVSPTTAQHVRSAFNERDVFVLDGGPCSAGIESTVVSLMNDEPQLLRLGIVSAQEIEHVLGRPVRRPADADAHAGAASSASPLPSPGMLTRHYAPSTPTRVVGSHELIDLLGSLVAERPTVILSHLDRNVSSPHRVVKMPADGAAYAARLYAALREADDANAARILIEAPPSDTPLWEAIADRLRRASASE